MNQKKSETALITGASAGIGYELALRFAREGHPLVIVSRSRERLSKLAGEIRQKYGSEPVVIPCDLSRCGSASELFKEVQSRKIHVDILVNNAGVGMYGFFQDGEPALQTDMIQLNVTSLTELTRLFLPAMLEKKRGKILNVASTAAFQPGPYMAVYYASKAYVLSFTEALKNELKGTGVSATVLCPGPTESEFQHTSGMTDLRLFNLTMMKAAPVADAGYRGLMAGKTVVLPGFMNKITPLGARLFPRGLLVSIVRHVQGKRR